MTHVAAEIAIGSTIVMGVAAAKTNGVITTSLQVAHGGAEQVHASTAAGCSTAD